MDIVMHAPHTILDLKIYTGIANRSNRIRRSIAAAG